MDQTTLGQDMASKLYAAERAVDNAIAAVADLQALMTRGRLSNRIAATVGQGALERVTNSGRVLTKARGQLVDAHVRMADDAASLGIEYKLTTLGGPETKPEDGPRRPPIAHLSEAA